MYRSFSDTSKWLVLIATLTYIYLISFILKIHFICQIIKIEKISFITGMHREEKNEAEASR